MKNDIDFGTIGIKMNEIIEFKDGTHAIVASGNGTPDNGGTLLQEVNPTEPGSFSILYFTKKKLNYPLGEDEDIWSLWFYNGKSLREIFNNKIQ